MAVSLAASIVSLALKVFEPNLASIVAMAFLVSARVMMPRSISLSNNVSMRSACSLYMTISAAALDLNMINMVILYSKNNVLTTPLIFKTIIKTTNKIY